ncbi:MAG: DUF4180 domain-containing protein [Sphaerochaetaceae bacterium]|nr:DUF4180 domain-containing protein [Sphaerochaetaceae bacterium]
MKIIQHEGIPFAIAEEQDRIDSLSDALDLMAVTRYHSSGDSLIIAQKNICDTFFDLSSGFAGEVLQKFSTYRMRLAITGPLQFTSRALTDFIYECNCGDQIIWAETAEDALSRFCKTLR